MEHDIEMIKFSTKGFSIEENTIIQRVNLNTQFKNLFSIDGQLSLFNQTIGSTTAGEPGIGNQFVKSNFLSRIRFCSFSGGFFVEFIGFVMFVEDVVFGVEFHISSAFRSIVTTVRVCALCL